jgi:hypothetical protein
MIADTRRIAAGILAFCLLVFSCGTQQSAGNTLEVGNPSVCGTLYEPDGTTPARDAAIYIVKHQSPARSAKRALMKGASDAAYATTDETGYFEVGELDTGMYILEGNDLKSNLVLIDSIRISDTTQKVSLPPDTLKPAGAISGVIRLSEAGDPRKVLVLLFNVDRFARVETGGSFVIGNLAESRYALRFIPAMTEYGVVDTAASVVSGDTANIGVISLPFLGIAAPKNVAAACDTARQEILLSWNKPDTSVAGCLVYRRENGSDDEFSQMNGTPVSDSIFRDSTVFGNLEFEYRVSCLGKNGIEGPRSASVTARAMSYFTVDTTIQMCGYGPCSMISLALTPGGRVYAVDNGYEYAATVFDSALRKTNLLNLPEPMAIYAASDDAIYGWSASDRTVFVLGDNLAPLGVFGGRQLSQFVLNSRDELVGFAGANPLTSDTVETVEMLHGSVVASLPWPGSNPSVKGLAVGKDNTLYLSEDKSAAVWVFDSTGARLRTIAPGLPPQAVAVDAEGRIVLVVGRQNYQRAQVFDPRGTFLAQCNLTCFGGYYFDFNSVNRCSLACRGTTLYFGLDTGQPNTSTILVKLSYRIP